MMPWLSFPEGFPGMMPVASSIMVSVTLPGRRITGTAPLASITVDSSPPSAAPQSRIMARSALPPSSSRTCPARVGLMRPERFADGAATGTPASARKARAWVLAGTRRATLSSPDVASVLIGQSGCWSSTSVIGPGQKWSARMRARGVSLPVSKTVLLSAT